MDKNPNEPLCNREYDAARLPRPLCSFSVKSHSLEHRLYTPPNCGTLAGKISLLDECKAGKECYL